MKNRMSETDSPGGKRGDKDRSDRKRQSEGLKIEVFKELVELPDFRVA